MRSFWAIYTPVIALSLLELRVINHHGSFIKRELVVVSDPCFRAYQHPCNIPVLCHIMGKCVTESIVMVDGMYWSREIPIDCY